MSVPPGASYRVSNTYVIAKRHLLRLEHPVPIRFDSPWEEGNPLFDWYRRRSSRFIHTMQLRKEDESPFFHKYIVFSLRDGGGYFRMDRRQRPDESAPLDCIYKDGVEAQDTIEEVTSLEDETYCPSRCLVEIEFRHDTPLALLLSAARAIQFHPQACVYTLQRYNCYFFAQALLLCVVRGIVETYSEPPETLEAHLRLTKAILAKLGTEGELSQMVGSERRRIMRKGMEYHIMEQEWIEYQKINLGCRPDHSPQDKQSLDFWHKFGHSTTSNSRLSSVAIWVNVGMVRTRTGQTLRSRAPLLRWVPGLRPEPIHDESPKRAFSYAEMHDYIGRLVDAHSARVGRFERILKCSADEVSKDMKSSMYEVWESVSEALGAKLKVRRVVVDEPVTKQPVGDQWRRKRRDGMPPGTKPPFPFHARARARISSLTSHGEDK